MSKSDDPKTTTPTEPRYQRPVRSDVPHLSMTDPAIKWRDDAPPPESPRTLIGAATPRQLGPDFAANLVGLRVRVHYHPIERMLPEVDEVGEIIAHNLGAGRIITDDGRVVEMYLFECTFLDVAAVRRRMRWHEYAQMAAAREMVAKSVIVFP